ncbi:MAG: hypothetical protein L0Y42_04135 [Phycisphaerales bacterium]|nr:hypothetical protein [Phycisphaerales bacterium]
MSYRIATARFARAFRFLPNSGRLIVPMLASLGMGSGALGQIASALVVENGALPGGPAGHTIFSINNSGVNHAGGFSFSINSSDGVATLSHVWGNASGGPGTVLRTEGTFGLLVQTAYESFCGMSDSGAVGYSATGTGGPVGGFDSVWVDDTPIAVEGDGVSGMPGQFWVFGSRPGITADGQIYWGGGFSAVMGGTTQNRGLFFGASATPLYVGGTTPPGLPAPINGSTINFDYRMSALGTHWIAPLTMSVPATSANDATILFDGVGLELDGALVREGSPVPALVGGLAGENWANFDLIGITENGDYLITGDTSAATTQDEFVLVNGQIVLREGQVLDGETLIGDIEGGYMNEDGDIAVTWDIVGPVAALEALIVNDKIVLVEGDLVDLDGDGSTEPNSVLSDFTGISALTISDRDEKGNVRLYFTADVDTLGTPSTSDDTEGGFVLEIDVVVCAADVAPPGGDGVVNVADLLALIGVWGPCPGCPEDLVADGTVNVLDLLALIAEWGACD